MAAYNENFGDSSSDDGSVDLEQLILHDVDFAPSGVENVPGIFGKGDRRFDPLLLLEANEDLDQYHYMSEFKLVKEFWSSGGDECGGANSGGENLLFGGPVCPKGRRTVRRIGLRGEATAGD